MRAATICLSHLPFRLNVCVNCMQHVQYNCSRDSSAASPSSGTAPPPAAVTVVGVEAAAAASRLWPAQRCFATSSRNHVQHPVHVQQIIQPTVARVLDGKAVAAAWSSQLQQQVPEIQKALGRRPGLAVVLVGSRPDSVLYVSRKEEACQRVGLHCTVLRLPDSVSQPELQDAVKAIAANPSIDGILIQLPLPPHLDEEAVMEFLDPKKDVDGFHPLNMGRMLMRGRAPRFVPATPLGVVELLSRSSVSVAGKTAVILGDSNIVGTPLAALLRDAGAALVTTCHRVSYQEWFGDRGPPCQMQRAQADVCLPRLPGPTPAVGRSQHPTELPPQHHGSTRFQASQLPAICSTADILVVAVGSPELVRQEWVKPGAVVVDVGINVVPLDGGGVTDSTAGAGQQHQSPAVASVAAAASQHVQWQQQPQQYKQRQQQEQQQEQQQHAPLTSSMQLAQGSGPGADSSSLISCGSSWRVVGDVAHEEVAQVASVLTPVPGGVGPMTIAAVLHNTLQAARYSAGLLPW